MTHTERLTSEVNRLGAQLAAVTRQLGEADTRVVNAELQAEEVAGVLRAVREDLLDASSLLTCSMGRLAAEAISDAKAKIHKALAVIDQAGKPQPDILPDPRIAELQR